MKHLALLLCLFAGVVQAQDARQAMIEFAAPTTYDDGTPIEADKIISYQIWQGLKGEPKSVLGTTQATQTTITTGLEAGKEYCWQVVAVVDGHEPAEPSNEGCKLFTLPRSPSVTITVR